MRILIIGSGAREHALVWKIKQSPHVSEVYCAPGNPGMARDATCVPIAVEDMEALLDFAVSKSIDLTVVGPEVPLVAGIVDYFSKKGLRIFGPGAQAAQLEGSKSFSKAFLKRHHIPTADFSLFSVDEKEAAITYCQRQGLPIVLKADGLAAGKGVYVCATQEELDAAISALFDRRCFGDAGARIVIESCLVGEEVSVFAFSDGITGRLMVSCQDHKRAFDGDTGPNTGGMGAYSPAPVLTSVLEQHVFETIVMPTLKGMADEGMPYKGVLYVGLMMTVDGPYVLEFNVRFGDPEAQVILMRLASDLVPIMMACVEGKGLLDVPLIWDDAAAICVVLAAKGYPGVYEKGHRITVNSVFSGEEALFCAGVGGAQEALVTQGGRVMGLTVKAEDIAEAIDKVYHRVSAVHFDGMFYRRDIGKKALDRPGQVVS